MTQDAGYNGADVVEESAVATEAPGKKERKSRKPRKSVEDKLGGPVMQAKLDEAGNIMYDEAGEVIMEPREAPTRTRKPQIGRAHV